jgi:hypothetical protein
MTRWSISPCWNCWPFCATKDFQTWIVSGGGIHFVRTFADEAYGIPPEQVLGSATPTEYRVIDGVPTIVKQSGIAFLDDGDGKPVGIDSRIGKRPIFAAGNSDGDFQMLEYTMAGDGARFVCSCTIPTPHANGPTTARATSAASTAASTRARIGAG